MRTVNITVWLSNNPQPPPFPEIPHIPTLAPQALCTVFRTSCSRALNYFARSLSLPLSLAGFSFLRSLTVLSLARSAPRPLAYLTLCKPVLLFKNFSPPASASATHSRTHTCHQNVTFHNVFFCCIYLFIFSLFFFWFLLLFWVARLLPFRLLPAALPILVVVVSVAAAAAVAVTV